MTKIATIAAVLALASSTFADGTHAGVRIRTEVQGGVPLEIYVVVHTDDFKGGFDARDVDLSVFGRDAFLFDVNGDELDDLVVWWPAAPWGGHTGVDEVLFGGGNSAAVVPFHRIINNTIYGGFPSNGDGSTGKN